MNPAATHASLPTADTLPAAPDTLAAAAPRQAIVLTHTQKDAAAHTPAHRPDTSYATSWLTLGIIALFLLIALRYRRNFRFLHTILSDLTSARQRRNMFDDTVRETTFMTLMNLLSIVSIGTLLAATLLFTGHTPPPAPGHTFYALWPAMLITGVYYIAQITAYSLIGFTFLPPRATTSWIKGFTSVQTLLGLMLFPLAMLGIFYPHALPIILLLAALAYFAARFIFISQSIRIFSAHYHSYILFLYYLCTIEIVPIFIIWHFATSFSPS